MSDFDFTALEALLNKLCAEHDLRTVEIGLNLNQSSGSRFGAAAHWKGFSRTGVACALAHGKDAAEALSNVITQAAEARVTFQPDERELRIERLRNELATLEDAA